MRTSLIGIFSLSLFSLLMSPAHSYIPRSGYQVEKISKRHSDFESVMVDSEVVHYEDGEPTGTVLYERSIVDYRSRKFQSVATTSSGKKVYEIVRNLGKQSTHIPALMALLFENEPRSLQLSLIGLGIPVLTDAEIEKVRSEEDRRSLEKVSIQKIENKFYWVIGTESQLWIEKDTFLPLKMIWTDPASGRLMTAEFDRFGFSDGFPFPAKIILKKEEKIIVEVRSKRPQTNPANLKFLPKPINGLSPYGSRLSDSYRRLVRNYYRILR